MGLSPLPVLPVISATPQSAIGKPLSDDWWSQTNANMAAETDIPQPIAPVRTTGTAAPVTPAATTTPTVSTGVISALGTYLGFPTTNVSGVNTSSNFLTRGVFIALGMMLVAAGIFAFKQTQTVIQTAGKIAEVAA